MPLIVAGAAMVKVVLSTKKVVPLRVSPTVPEPIAELPSAMVPDNTSVFATERAVVLWGDNEPPLIVKLPVPKAVLLPSLIHPDFKKVPPV